MCRWHMFSAGAGDLDRATARGGMTDSRDRFEINSLYMKCYIIKAGVRKLFYSDLISNIRFRMPDLMI